MKKTILSLMALLLVAVGAAAQPGANAEQKKKIAEIKKDPSYISAEMNASTKEEALRLAHEMLVVNINNWMKEQKKFADAKQAVVLNKGAHTEEIVLPRANVYRAFVYVKTSDILPSNNVTVIDNEPTAKPEPVAKKPDKATKQETAAKKPAKAAAVDNSNHAIVVRELLAQQNTGQLLTKLHELKDGGRITEYCRLRDLKNKNAAEYIMVIFTSEGRLQAVLSEGEQRRNLRTGEADDMSNYAGMGAIGVKTKR